MIRKLRTPHILFIEEYFYPEGWPGAEIPRGIVNYLHNHHNYPITVLTGSRQYLDIQNQTEHPAPAINIRRISIPSFFFRRSRLLSQLYFGITALYYILSTSRPLCVISQTNPPAAIPFISFACYFRRIKLAYICMDIYPQILFNSINQPPLKMLARLCLGPIYKLSYHCAALLIFPGYTMAQRFASQGFPSSRTKVIQNWAVGINPCKSTSTSTISSISSHFNLVYTGNIGTAHDNQLIYNVISRFSPSQIQLILAVSQQSRDTISFELPSLIKDNRLLLRAQSQNLAVHDGSRPLGLLTLRNNYEHLVFPSKFYSYLMRGWPVVYVGPHCDISDFINTYDVGFHCLQDDDLALTTFITRLIRDPHYYDNLRQSVCQHYNNDSHRLRSLARYLSAVHELTAR